MNLRDLLMRNGEPDLTEDDEQRLSAEIAARAESCRTPLRVLPFPISRPRDVEAVPRGHYEGQRRGGTKR